MKTLLILVCLSVALGLVSSRSETYRRVKRGAYKEKGDEELKYKDEKGWNDFYEAAKKIVEGDWMTKEIVLIKFWKMSGFDKDIALPRVKDANEYIKQKQRISAWQYNEICGKMDASMGEHKDKDGRMILYKHLGKTPMVDYTGDSEKRPLWEAAFRELWYESAQKAVKRWEDKKSDYTTFTLIYNFEGWTAENGACVTCVSFCKALGKDFDSMFPRMTYKVQIINTPATFEAFFKLIRLVLSKETNDKIDVYGTNWREHVEKIVEKGVLDQFVK